MPSRMENYPKSYADAALILGTRESRVIGPSTKVEWRNGDGGALTVTYAGEWIVKWSGPEIYGPGDTRQWVFLRNNGRWTRAAQDRINACLPVGFLLTGECSDQRYITPSGAWRFETPGRYGRVEFYENCYLRIDPEWLAQYQVAA